MAKDELPPSHLLCPPPPFTSRPQLRGLGLKSAVSSPSGVWGEAPADERFCAYWNQKVQLWWQQFLLIFLRKKCNFLHKNKLDIVRRVQLLTVRRPVSFFPGAVATIALRKLAPMLYCLLLSTQNDRGHVVWYICDTYAYCIFVFGHRRDKMQSNRITARLSVLVDASTLSGLKSHTTNKSLLWKWVVPGNRLHWYWQTNSQNEKYAD